MAEEMNKGQKKQAKASPEPEEQTSKIVPAGKVSSWLTENGFKVSDNADTPEEVRVKVFLPREKPTVASLYWIWKSADWQERESYDMYGIVYEGHPNLKRILMPEDWIGWPLRKDYISPDFYELQDAY